MTDDERAAGVSAAPAQPGDGDQLVDALRRWELSGGVWRVVTRRPAGTTVALLRCDAGEEVERITCHDSAWLGYLEGRERSDD